jgi:regulator of chromosome condensation
MSNNFVQDNISRLQAKPTGSVVVFGSGDCGQLGMGEDFVTCPRPKRHPFFEGKGIVAVAAGGLHTLALSQGGQVFSWGCNDERALGHPAAEFTVSRVLGLNDEFIVQIACGDSISAALSAEGRIYTWGTFRDSKGIIGVRDPKRKKLAEPKLRSRSSLASSSSSSLSSCTSLPVSEIDAPEDSNPEHFNLMPTLLADLAHLRVKAIAVGANHVLALVEDGEVYAWGSGEQGQLGKRVLERHKLRALHPTRITPRRHRQHGGIVAITAGSYHSFLLARDGTVFAVGLNNFGQLGADDFEDRLVAEALPADTWQGEQIVALAAGEHHSLALAASGRVFVFGRADSNQLGIPRKEGDARAYPAPVLHPFLKSVTFLAAGTNHNLAVAGKGQLWSWGYGEMGQLGHDEEVDEVVPRRIEVFSEQTSFLDVSAGGQHTVVLITKSL